MKNILVAVLALVAAGSLGYSVYLHQRGGAAEGPVADPLAARGDAQREAELRDRIRSLEFENSTLRNQLADARDGGLADAAPVEGGPPAGMPGREGGRGGPPGEWRERAQQFFLNALRNDPDMALLARLDRQREVDQRFSDFFRMARLTPEQTEEVRALLTTRELARRTAPLAAREAGVDPDDPAAMQAFLSQTMDPINTALQQELGAAGWQQLQSYETTLPHRDTVNQLAQRLSYSGAPLADTQRESLAQVLATAPVVPNRPSRRAPVEEWNAYFQQVSAANAATVAQARSVLNTQQAEAFAAQRAEELQRQQLRVTVAQNMRAAREAMAGGPPPGN